MLIITMTPAESAFQGLLLLAAVGFCSSQLQVDLDCLEGWAIKGHYCYKLFTDLLPWASAERICAGNGGHLATPFDYYENEDIGKFVNDRGVDQFWIGVNRVGVPPNDNRALQYNGGLETRVWVGYWSVFQPKFSDGDCIYVTKDKRQLHKWSFGPCEMNTAYLCQRPVCAKGSFHCVNGNCVSPKAKCDGYNDCGDRSDEIDCPANCSWHMKTSGPGTIIYPTSGNYINNADCSWLIETDLGINVMLTVNSLSLESDSDELIVMDGGLIESSSMEIVRLTGQPQVPKYYYSSNNKMFLRFRSDGSVTNKGFNVSYSRVNSSLNLPTKLIATNDWQTQEFPYYNSYLLGNQDISFVVEALDQKQTVTIEVLDMDLPSDAEGLIRNGQTVYDNVLSVLSGSFKGSSVAFSTGRYLYISLHTVRGSQNRGLKFRYIQGCKAETSQAAGYINSPGYSISYYPNSVICNWTVTVPEGKDVTLYFNFKDVHISDTIQVIVANSILGNYTGNNLEAPLRVNGGYFSVVFYSSATLNSQGFNLTYSVDCPMPMIDLNLTDITGTRSTSYGSDFTVSCKQGSRFTQAEHMNKTSVRMMCMASGLWNVNTSPKCEYIRCSKAPAVQNGYIASSAGNLTYNATVTYKCYQGFTLSGSVTASCDMNGQWVNVPLCQASSCPIAPVPDSNGSQNITLGDGRMFGTVLRYYCNEGYDLLGDPTMFCDTNGMWVGNASTCKILTCYMSSISNGILSSSKVPVGQQITVTCNTGYRTMTGETRMTCNSNRTFTPLLSCQNINECENNSTCQHSCTDTQGSYICTCRPGFEVTGNTCTDIDECSTMNPCNGTCTNTDGSYQCNCPVGYSLFVSNGTQGHFIPPSEDGKLAGDVYRLNHSCVRNLCAAPPLIVNAELLSLKTKHFYNDSVMYKCLLGFILQNPITGTLTCNENGNWTGPEINCSRAMCFVDPVPSNLTNPGAVTPANTSIGFGEEIVINCSRPGFSPPNFTRKRICTLIGQEYKLDGSVHDYDCGFVSCGQPQDEPGSVYTNLSSPYYGSSFIFGCKPAFKLEGASTLNRNATVTCQSSGQWDFGTLTCTGIQCTDPGQPYLGQQLASSDYREGQLVNFTCKLPGYTLHPPYPISCRLQNGVAGFNDSLPRCVDSEKPIITNCPRNEILIDEITSAGSVIPELKIQDNGAVRNLSVSPAWPSSNSFVTPLKKTAVFIYTVTDYGNNQAVCNITIRLKDTIPPTIICPRTSIFKFREENDIISPNISRAMVTVNDDVTPANELKVSLSKTNYTFTPKNNLYQSFPPIHDESVLATVEDAAGNKAFCNFELYFEPDVCSPYYFRKPPNSNTTCMALGSGYECTVTCNPGFVLYNNVSANSFLKSCPHDGVSFPADPDIKCINLTSLDGSYKLEFDFVYDGKNISNICRNSYEDAINRTLKDLTTVVIPDNFCETPTVKVTGNITLGSLSISETEQKVLVRYVVKFHKMPGSKYSACATGVKELMKDPPAYVTNLVEFIPLECDTIYLTTNRSLVFNGYYCDDHRRQQVTTGGPDNVSYCLPCPEGTYSNNSICTPCPRGTYNPMPNMDMCLPCPKDTSTYTPGAVNRSECAPECVAGSISNTGLPPCSLCPPNTYWINATTCQNCEANTLTRGNGSKNVDDCRKQCQPGTYNEVDGYAECKKCPMHFYTNEVAAVRCMECPVDYYTNSTEKTSASDCLKLNESSCLCQHGTCIILPHVSHVKSCVCDEGWYGEYCDKSFDPCLSNPCDNSAGCIRNGSNYNCACLPGTSGQKCEYIIPTCTPTSCQNNGMCENLVNKSRCHCLPGFTGDMCQTVQNICASGPCKNGGACNPLGNVRFSCACPSGFTGKTCEETKDYCYQSPCRNNGTCRNTSNYYECECHMSYSNPNCDTRGQLCTPAICGPAGRCIENELNNSYICVCSESAERSSDGISCQNKDFCSSRPCMNNGTCVSSGISFTCSCPLGFGGSLCQHDINDCLNTPCQHGGKCQDLVGSFECNCSGTGYEGSMCETNVNDCASMPCHAGVCMDMVNGYKCQCNSGYTGKNCEANITECDLDPCLHNGTCVDMVNDYMCQCPRGWIGKNCEIEMKMCTSTTCLNGATCNDYFNGYFCKCRPNTYEKDCSASVDICKVANPCVHGSCMDKNGNAECTCEAGYEGDQCDIQQNFCSTNMSVCMNGGQCIPQLDNYSCKCQPGYTTKDCFYPVDNCGSKQCPVGSTCYNLEEKAYCRCPLDKEGPACDKAWDQDFDLLFDHEHRTGMAYLQYPIHLNSSSFSISFWVQFGKMNDMGTFLSMFTVQKRNSLRNKHLLLWIDEKSIYYNSNGMRMNFTHDIKYNDGKWHYLVVNVNRNSGILHLIVDAINSMPVSIPGNGTFDDNIWLVLGAMYDPVTEMPVKYKGFYGKLSKVTVYSRELLFRNEVTIVGLFNISSLFNNSILRWSSEFRYSGGVKRQVPSVAKMSCPFGYTGYPTCTTLLPGKQLIKIANGQCPSDILQYSPNRVTQVTWPVPTFTGQDSQKSSWTSGDTFVWGKYPVEIVASNADGNTALCLFNIFVQNDNCTNPPKPPNAQDLQCFPTNYEKYKQCGMICNNNTAPSIASPRIHTCGPVGNWDPENRFIPYRITPCGAITQPMRQLVINLRYSVLSMECAAVTDTLKRELLKTQVALNTDWNRVCTQTNCSDTIIDVKCLNARRKRQATTANRLDMNVTLTMNDIQDTVVSRSNNSVKRTEDLYRDLILAMPPGNPFDYSNLVADASPTLNSMNTIPMCAAPKVLLENQCVDCGPGTFYNATEMECQFCPIGSYQPLSAQNSCIPCPQGTTTPSMGTYINSECYKSCPAGQYMNLMSSPPMCTNCSRGQYQPQSGQFSCLVCPAHKTTKYPGTELEKDCSNDCPPGQEIDSSNNCTDCRIGYYREPNDALCQKCPAGRVTQNTSSVFAADCNVADNPPGTRRKQNDSTTFEKCPIGTYQSQWWQYNCISCDPNYLTEQEGSTNATDCKFFCPVGQEKKPNENSCVPCAVGFYHNGSNFFEKCSSCGPNYTTMTMGSTSSDNCTIYRCSVGQQPNAANTGCEQCPKGTYQDMADMPNCHPCSSDNSTRNTGAIKPEACESYCPSGKEKKGTSCNECPIGYYKDNSEDLFGNCTRCKDANFVTSSVGAVSNSNCTVLNCVEGYKINNTTKTCDPCPRGTYQNMKYQNDCIPCGDKKSTRQSNSTKPEDCEIYCDPGFEKIGTSCNNPCPRGYYKDNTVDLFMPCTLCNIKYVTPEGPPASNASQCTILNCTAGSYINGDNCTFCSRGYYQDKPWQENCTMCGINRNTETEGANNSSLCLLSCPAGLENSGNSDACDPCMMGYYKDKDGATKCTPCANFTENNIKITPMNGSKSQSECTKFVCLAGYRPVNNSCIPCDLGTYQPVRWSDSCISCSQGYTTYKTGSISPSDCEQSCPSGQELVNGTCTPCKVGFYNDKSDPTRKLCVSCPSGKITAQTGATSAAQCTVTDCSTLGQYRDPADNMCKNCSRGTYQDTIRQDKCKNCPTGDTTQFIMSTSISDCKNDCDSGYHLEDLTNSCVPCATNTYRDKSEGTWDCVRCDDNLITTKTGSTKASDCVALCTAGTAYERSKKACVPCPKNTYANDRGLFWPCISCPDGQVTKTTQTSSADECKFPCASGDNCNIVSEVCENVQDSFRCDCRSEYIRQNGQCVHRCEIPKYCGDKGDCIRAPFKCKCRDGYTGVLCDIRPDAQSMSNKETETIIIAVVTTGAALLFLILLVVCICVMSKKRRSIKTPHTSEIDEHTSIATRSVKGYDDYPTFAVNPAFSSKPPSVFGGPNGALPSQGIQMYNPTYGGDEDNDPAVYRA